MGRTHGAERLGRRTMFLQIKFTRWPPDIYLLETVNGRIRLLKEQGGDWTVAEVDS